MTIVERVESLLKEILRREPVEPLPVAVYLFGSHARGEARHDSDVDLAFAFAPKEYRERAFECFSRAQLISARIALELDIIVDVLVLNDASIEMAYQVIIERRCLYDPDPESRWEREALIRGLYYDFKPFLDELRAGYMRPGRERPLELEEEGG